MSKVDPGAGTGTAEFPEAGGTVSRPPLLQMREITKGFFGVPVLETVNLEVMAGEVLAVVGENGAGKSILMKILAGASEIQKVLIAGHVLAEGEGASR